jgi:hypothetical protein
LLGFPSAAAPEYVGVLMALINYRQTRFELQGQSADAHRLKLTAPGEHVLNIRLGPFNEGVHRVVLLLLDDDGNPGFSGAYDLWADVYVGASPRAAAQHVPRKVPARSDPVVEAASYGVRLTTSPDRLMLVSKRQWSAGEQLWISFWGDVREGERPVVITVFQDFRQRDIDELTGWVVALPGRVSTIPIKPKQPTLERESIRVIMMTAPDLELAPAGEHRRDHTFRAYASQKAYIERGAN